MKIVTITSPSYPTPKKFVIILFKKQLFRRIRKRRELEKPMKKRTRMKCPKCEKSFQKYENFEAHLRIHFGKKVFSNNFVGQ